jgi:hypothetical protein
MTNTNETSVDLNDLLDTQLDDIADLPEFKNFPVGGYRCAVTMEAKKIGSKNAVEVQLKMLEVLELSDPEAVPPNVGDSCNACYFHSAEYGWGSLKKIAAQFAEVAGSGSLKDIVAAVKGIECTVITSLRADKKHNALPENKDSPRYYLEIKELAVM